MKKYCQFCALSEKECKKMRWQIGEHCCKYCTHKIKKKVSKMKKIICKLCGCMLEEKTKRELEERIRIHFAIVHGMKPCEEKARLLNEVLGPKRKVR